MLKKDWKFTSVRLSYSYLNEELLSENEFLDNSCSLISQAHISEINFTVSTA